MKNLSLSASFIANKYHVSDTYVHETFLRYVDCKRLPLPPILSVDEVYLNFDSKNRYALVLMDFITGEIVDILPNRFKDTYQRYFMSIPLEERNQVKYLICDMYNPYLNFVSSYFRQATSVVDSFHVIQWMNHKINLYINSVKKKYQDRNYNLLKEKNYLSNKENQSAATSNEAYLLNQYRWLILTNQSHIKYNYQRHYNRRFKQYLSIYDYEKKFFELDPHFKEIRDLKELYIQFNDSFLKPHDQAEKELDTLIHLYQNQSLVMFQEFAQLLQKYRTEIVCSFTALDHSLRSTYVDTLTQTGEELNRRLSNGPIESFNRKPKDLKRNSRGFQNIEYTINRILWANRKNQSILAVPKTIDEVKTKTGKIRETYHK